MPFSHVAENRIRHAIAEGEFDNLPNAGQPVDLQEYFSTPVELRLAYSVLKSAGCAPLEVELLKEVAQLKEAVAAASGTCERERLQRALTQRQTQLSILLERRSRGEK